ncbi:hypothetical protein H2198_004709 [Neophaeococcomyces mojaviensis]|uniref:Uncharacterized protein n=1 Tax=Neophaeococcomyces mojaviensis TaxID=3383035 RepID=A0ACC3A856_9EURO|nr:hypothetical protein H2198_004709 [Knufia sp. JES_112]
MISAPVVIIGGGIVGLTLAQALKQASIPFEIYERDTALETEKGGGWAITIHWALNALEQSLPPNLFKQLENIQVDPEQGVRDTGRFLFLNLATALPKYEIPPSKRMRVNRKLLRQLLAEGIDIKFGKSLVGFDALGDGDTATVHFEDGTTTTGALVVACDGANSRMRHLLFPEASATADLQPLPVKCMGVTIRMTEDQVIPLREIDPLLFQGVHPDSGKYMWYSTVSTPPINGSEHTTEPFYEGQIIMSWRRFSPEDDIPNTDEKRRQMMCRMASNFEQRLKTAVHSIPEGTKVTALNLADWPTRPWPNHNGRVTLAGDAAHAMTMYRGEAFNHGITDAANLAKQLISGWSQSGNGTLQKAVETYEKEVLERTHDAVLLSRQACLDAHDYHNLHADSPLVSKRAKVLAPAKAVVGNDDAILPEGELKSDAPKQG